MTPKDVTPIFAAHSVAKAVASARRASAQARRRAPLEARRTACLRRRATLENRISRVAETVAVRPHIATIVAVCVLVGLTVFLGLVDATGYEHAALAGATATCLAACVAIAGNWQARYPRGLWPLMMAPPVIVLVLAVGYVAITQSAIVAVLMAAAGIALLYHVLRTAWAEWRLVSDQIELDALANEIAAIEADLVPPVAATLPAPAQKAVTNGKHPTVGWRA